MPRKSLTMIELEQLAIARGLDLRQVMARTRGLLEAYRRLEWLAQCSLPEAALTPEAAGALAAYLHHGSQGVGGAPPQLGPALALMRQALEQVAAYPSQGPLLAAILKSSYFAREAITDETLAHHLHLERSTYYQRKREAVLLYALTLLVSEHSEQG